ncbi:hypothetical protein D9M70_574520 [compost metagenome]
MGNQYTAAPLMGQATLNTASPTTVVTHGGVAPNASIMLIPTSSVFAAKQASSGIYSGPNGVDFNVVTADGTNASAASTFRYKIEQ